MISNKVLQIVYEDEHIIICNKPAGVASQSDKSMSQDLESGLKAYLKKNGKGTETHIINRLDKPVGGLVLFALDKKTAAALSAMSGEHSIEKKYLALVTGKLTDKGTYTDWLKKDAKNNFSTVAGEHEEGAKKASLSFQPLGSQKKDGKDYTLVEIKLHTGRHHQIRVQFSSRGQALYGDTRYNADFRDARRVYPMLFAYKLSFMNPYGADRISVEVLPESHDWKETLSILQKKDNQE